MQFKFNETLQNEYIRIATHQFVNKMGFGKRNLKGDARKKWEFKRVKTVVELKKHLRTKKSWLKNKIKTEINERHVTDFDLNTYLDSWKIPIFSNSLIYTFASTEHKP